MLLDVTRAEFNTILGALRFYQECGMGEPLNRSDRIQEIVCPDADDTSLSADEIDALCERLNCQPEISADLKRLFMAEIDNEAQGGDSPATLQTVRESLVGGYEPYLGFPVQAVQSELDELIAIVGNANAERFVTTADWQNRAKSV